MTRSSSTTCDVSLLPNNVINDSDVQTAERLPPETSRVPELLMTRE